LSKRLSEQGKKLIVKYFTEGKTIVELAKEFDCTNNTIVRNLKNKLGNEKYKELVNRSKIINKSIVTKTKDNDFNKQNDLGEINNISAKRDDDLEEEVPIFNEFTEITPLDYQIDNNDQKDLSSVPINNADLPKIVYMIVDKKIELETKYLKEYPAWEFLPQEDLNRKTLEIYVDLKIAKRICGKEHKVIKIPDSNIFKIVAPILLNKGISRIVSPDQLIAL
jgi:hypothetical protein